MRRVLAQVVLPALALLTLAPAAHGAPGVNRVVGGVDATATDAPWQALVLQNGFLCGGSIVDETHVVTAAHCVYDEDAHRTVAASAFTIRAGITDRYVAGGQTRTVSAVSMNATYDPDEQTGDAAILTLSAPLPLDGTTIAALGLTDVGWRPVDGVTPLRLSGWGSTAQRDPYASTDGVVAARDLQVATLKSTSTCADAYYGFSDALLLCAGQGGLDACQGDSGGPLAVQVNGTWNLAGIVTGGAGCAWPGYPGYYARVAEPGIHAFLAARGGDASLQEPAFTRQPAISGTAHIGQMLTCDPGTASNAYTITTTWLRNGVIISEDAALPLLSSDLGSSMQCLATAYGLAGTVEARSTAVTITVPAVAGPPTPTPTPAKTSVAHVDVAAPTLKVVRSSCSRHRVCVIDVRVSDPEPTAGIARVDAKVTTAYRSTCKVKGKRRKCTKKLTRRLTALPTTAAHGFRITTPALPKGTQTFTLSAVDAAGHKQATPKTLVRTTR